MHTQPTFNTRPAAEFYLKTLADSLHMQSLREARQGLGTPYYRELLDMKRADRLAKETERTLRGLK